MNTQAHTMGNFTTKRMFPGLNDLAGCQSAGEAHERAYPYGIIETNLLHEVDNTTLRVSGYKGLVRNDGYQLACVKNTYKVVQPIEVCTMFEPFIDSGLVELVAGGAIDNKLSLIGKIKGTERELKVGEEIAAYVNFYSGLTGNLGIGGSVFAIQARCLNGMHVRNNKLSLSTKHTKNVHFRLSDIQSAIAKVVRDYDKTIEDYETISTKVMPRAKQIVYIQNVFELGTGEGEISPRAQTKLARVIELLDTQKGLELVPAVRGTAMQAYSAVTEYLTYESGRTEESRLNSRLYGDSAALNSKALNLALSM